MFLHLHLIVFCFVFISVIVFLEHFAVRSPEVKFFSHFLYFSLCWGDYIGVSFHIQDLIFAGFSVTQRMSLQNLINSGGTRNGMQDLTFLSPRPAPHLPFHEGIQNMNPWQFEASPPSVEDGAARKLKTELKSVHTKLCARGHWRPHEDGRLRELVAQFGPQNWNLIAEKLQGRSGKKLNNKADGDG